MKRKTLLTVLLFSIILTSCSSDSDNNSNASIKISPPGWIQGAWYLEGNTNNTGYKFSNDDFCLITFNTQSCFKEQLRLADNSGTITNIKELVTDNSYSIEITISSQVLTYKFEKISSTEIEWVNHPLGDLTEVIYIKQ